MRRIFFILLCGYWLNLTAETNEPPISLHFKDINDNYYIHNNPLSIKLQTHINNKSLINEPLDLWVNIQMPIPKAKVDLFINAGGINGNPEPFKKNITVSDLTDTVLEMPAIPASIPAGKYVFSAYYSKTGSAFAPQTASLSNWAIAEIRIGSHSNGFDADPRPQNTTCIAPARSAIPSKLSQTGCVIVVEAGKKIKPAAGVMPYNVNLLFWSDGAFKERWMAIPADTSISINKEGHWVFPIGSILFKHFYLQDKIFETRLLIHHDDDQVNLPQPKYNMPLEQRARAYLHTNCGYCHRPGGEGKYDFRITADFSDICYKQ